MARFGSTAEPRLLGLDEVADTVATLELGAGAQVGEWPDLAIRPDPAFLGAHAYLDMASVADFDIAQPRGALDPYVGADTAAPENLHVGADDRVAPNLDVLPDIGACRIDEGDPRLHQPAVNRRPNVGFHHCHLHP